MSNSKSENLYGTAYAGQAVAVIPIQVPSGRQVNHQLNLRYCSGVGLGPVGIGWNLDHKKIFKSQHDREGNQYFLSGENGSREFRSNWGKTWFTTNDELNPKISAWTDQDVGILSSVLGQKIAILGKSLISTRSEATQNSTFLVEEPAGAKLLFGKTPESRSFGKDWMSFKVANISAIHYPNGDNVQYAYRKPHRSDSYALVDYIFSPPSLLAEIQYRHGMQIIGRVLFTYEDRVKPLGETTLRLKSIEVHSHDRCLRSYKLSYDSQELLEAVELFDNAQNLLRTWSMGWETRNNEPLLSLFTNDKGAITQFRYQMVTDFPDNDTYITSQVVSERIVKDSRGGVFKTQYDYCGGRIDPTEGFIGFQKVMAREPDGTTVVTYLHVDRILRGRERLIEVIDAGGNLVQCTQNTWSGTMDTAGVKTVVLRATKTTLFENTPYQGAADKYDYDHGEGYGRTLVEHQYDTQHHFLASTTVSHSDNEDKTVYSYVQQDIGGWNWKVVTETESLLRRGELTMVSEHKCEYDLRGNQVKKTIRNGSDSQVTCVSYDTDGRVHEATDALGVTVKCVYDGAYLRSIEKNGAVVQSFSEYDPVAARPCVTTDENGHRTTTKFDSQGRPVEVLRPNGLRQTTTYVDDPANRHTITRQIAPDGEVIEHYVYYDGLDRVVQEASSSLRGRYVIMRTVFVKNTEKEECRFGPFFADSPAFLRVFPSSVPTVRNHYDSQGNLTEQRQLSDNGQDAITTIARCGLTTEISTPDGYKKSITKDLRDHVRTIIEHAATGDSITRYFYDAQGNVEQIINPINVATRFRHDFLGRLTESYDPLRGRWISVYDAGGNVRGKYGPDGCEMLSRVDHDNRPVLQKSTRGEHSVETGWQYGAPEVPNSQSRLTRIQREGIIDRILEYDAGGNILRKEREFVDSGKIYTHQTSYDHFGREVRVISPSGVVILKGYHKGTFLLRSIGTEDGALSATCADFDAFGQPTRIDYGNGTTNSFEYSTLTGRLACRKVTDRSGNVLEGALIERNPGGTIRTITDIVSNETRVYRYDELGRLTEDFAHSYTYDLAGNILSRTAASRTTLYKYDLAGQLRQVIIDGKAGEFSYDGSGNILAGPDLSRVQELGEMEINYTADGLPWRVRGLHDTVEFGYDGYGHKALHRAGEGIGTLYYENCQLDPVNNKYTTYLSIGDHPIALIET